MSVTALVPTLAPHLLAFAQVSVDDASTPPVSLTVAAGRGTVTVVQAAVPEPSTLLLGPSLVGLRAWRRHHNA